MSLSCPMMMSERVRMCRPFVEPTGLDHDDGIDGLSTERGIVLRRKGQHIGGIPVFAVAQMQKDKNQQMLNVSISSALCQSASYPGRCGSKT